MSATATSFGSYNPRAAAHTDTNGTVTLTCAASATAVLFGYTVSLSAGGAGSFTPRRMTSGAHSLQYLLYTNAARTSIWGDGSGGTSVIAGSVTLSPLPVTAAHTVYGRVPALQSGVAAGAYADVITVTVAY